jgi:prepilin peptidase CpaA
MWLGNIGILNLSLGTACLGGVLPLIAMLRGQRDYAYVPATVAGFVKDFGLFSLV